MPTWIRRAAPAWEHMPTRRSASGHRRAKPRFGTATHAVQVLRGRSARPLFVTAAGMPPAQAASLIRTMAGPFRLPDALRRADALAHTRHDHTTAARKPDKPIRRCLPLSAAEATSSWLDERPPWALSNRAEWAAEPGQKDKTVSREVTRLTSGT
jgi:hypothetical protein